jgi:hypothetical protein
VGEQLTADLSRPTMVQLACGETTLAPDMSLYTVRMCYWKQGGDMALTYDTVGADDSATAGAHGMTREGARPPGPRPGTRGRRA